MGIRKSSGGFYKEYDPARNEGGVKRTLELIARRERNLNGFSIGIKTGPVQPDLRNVQTSKLGGRQERQQERTEDAVWGKRGRSLR